MGRNLKKNWFLNRLKNSAAALLDPLSLRPTGGSGKVLVNVLGEESFGYFFSDAIAPLKKDELNKCGVCVCDYWFQPSTLLEGG